MQMVFIFLTIQFESVYLFLKVPDRSTNNIAIQDSPDTRKKPSIVFFLPILSKVKLRVKYDQMNLLL